MMTQTVALLVDAYRELCAKKLFWITMILSVVVVIVFAMVGINERGMTFLFWQLPSSLNGVTITSETMPPGLLYRTMFAALAVPYWLSWVAVALGLVSTAGMIPDLIQSGTIEAVLSRPIGRVRLLLTKFAGGLLFMTLQVGVFSLLVFLVIAIRGKSLAPEVFLAVPIVVAMFSYLFALCVLLGLLTRSTIAALLLTALFWLVLIIINAGDAISVSIHEQIKASGRVEQARVERMERNATLALLEERNAERIDQSLEPIDALEAPPTRAELDARDIRLPPTRAKLEELQSGERLAARWRSWIYLSKAVLPKTGETINLLGRWTVDEEELHKLGGPEPESDEERAIQEGSQATSEALGKRPLWWVLGTSFVFEALVLGIAVVIFKRRDF
jgi:ABC-type transport system involved in multi-copper enzyme maturation permease subunit